MNNVRKFVDWDVPELETLSGSMAYRVMDKLNKGEKLTREDKSLSIFQEIGHQDAYNHGYVKLMGYIFDFRPYMKVFLVKHKYYGWKEVVAFDKTSIRKNSANPSYILKIVELGDE